MASGISVVMVKRDVEDLEHQMECQQATMGARIPHHLVLAVSNGLCRTVFLEQLFSWDCLRIGYLKISWSKERIFPNSWRVFFMENPKKMDDDWGAPPYLYIYVDRYRYPPLRNYVEALSHIFPEGNEMGSPELC